MIILKNRNVTKPKNPFPLQSLVFQNSAGWIDNEILQVWLKTVMFNLNFESTPFLPYLLLDRCPAHTHKAIIEVLTTSKLRYRFIPSGCTGLIQPVGTHVGKAFKDHLRKIHKKWFEELGSLSSNTTKTGNFKDPAFDYMVEWILEAFDRINKDSIIHSFKHCGINLALDGNDDRMLNSRSKRDYGSYEASLVY